MYEKYLFSRNELSDSHFHSAAKIKLRLQPFIHSLLACAEHFQHMFPLTIARNAKRVTFGIICMTDSKRRSLYLDYY